METHTPKNGIEARNVVYVKALNAIDILDKCAVVQNDPNKHEQWVQATTSCR